MPAFNDPRLQEALEIAAPHIESFDDKLDAISNDIKTLESYLNDQGVEQVVEYEFTTYDEDYSGPDDSVTQESEHLVFARSRERWRIFYKRIRLRGRWLNPGIEWDLADILESRPLIEAKAEVRVRASKALTEFFKATVARRFVVDRTALDVRYGLPDEDIPF